MVYSADQILNLITINVLTKIILFSLLHLLEFQYTREFETWLLFFHFLFDASNVLFIVVVYYNIYFQNIKLLESACQLKVLYCLKLNGIVSEKTKIEIHVFLLLPQNEQLILFNLSRTTWCTKDYSNCLHQVVVNKNIAPAHTFGIKHSPYCGVVHPPVHAAEFF